MGLMLDWDTIAKTDIEYLTWSIPWRVEECVNLRGIPGSLTKYPGKDILIIWSTKWALIFIKNKLK